ncbi:NADPH oxidase organizer 1 [Mantella aurantiaca]
MPQQKNGTDRHPLEAKAVGVLQHGRFKINIFSILWSDHNDILIYRKYENFKDMHKELRRKFPLESGLLRKSDNMIPKLRDVPIFWMNRNTSRVIKRLRLLEDYCQQLLTADAKISNCEVVTSFFTPNSSDLNPNFPQNSLMIVPSEATEQKRERPTWLPNPPVAEPIVSQMYLCVEDHETKDTKNRPFKVKRNECLGVLIKENSGWWLVENEEKRVAWFPAPFLKTLETEEDNDSGMDSDDEEIRYYSTMAYEAMSWDEVSISRGVLVEVIEKSNHGWWLIRYNGKTGFAPAMYLKPYRTCHQLQIIKNHEKFPSTSNLFKSTSQQELSRPAEAWRMDKERNTAMIGSVEQVKAQKLDRRKSRSISGLPTSSAYGLYPNSAELMPGIHVQEVFQPIEKGQTPIPKDRTRDAIQKPAAGSPEKTARPLVQRQILHDKQDSPKQSLSRTEPPSGQFISHLPRTPLIPQRPKPHEILHKCTTVTKKALEMKQASAMHC